MIAAKQLTECFLPENRKEKKKVSWIHSKEHDNNKNINAKYIIEC